VDETDLLQEQNRVIHCLSESVQSLREEVADGPKAGHILALTQAVQYSALLQFHDLMLRYGGSTVEMSNEELPPENVERAKRILIASGLAKVPPPPFERSLRAAMVMAKIRVTEEAVDDAAKAEAAMREGADSIMTEASWAHLRKLCERTGKGPGELLENSLCESVALEASAHIQKEQGGDDGPG